MLTAGPIPYYSIHTMLHWKLEHIPFSSYIGQSKSNERSPYKLCSVIFILAWPPPILAMSSALSDLKSQGIEIPMKLNGSMCASGWECRWQSRQLSVFEEKEEEEGISDVRVSRTTQSGKTNDIIPLWTFARLMIAMLNIAQAVCHVSNFSNQPIVSTLCVHSCSALHVNITA